MANNGLGVFAGNFAQAFQQTTQAKQEQDRRDKMAKLQGQLVELQMKGAEQKLNAQTQVADLMQGEALTGFNITPTPASNTQRGTMPQLPPGAAGAGPAGPGEIMQSPQGLSAMMAAGYLDMNNLIPPPIDPIKAAAENRLQATESRNQAMFDQFAELMDGMGKQGTDNPLTVAGMTFDPNRGPVLQFGKNPDVSTPLQSELRTYDLGTFTDEAEDVIELSDSIANSSLIGMGTSVAKGAGTAQSVLAAVGDKFGMTSPEYKRALVDFDSLQKTYATILANETIKETGGTSSPTNLQLQNIMARVPTMDKQPQANFRLLANILEQDLEKNIMRGDTVSPQQETKVRATVDKLRAAAKGTPKASGSTIDLKAIPSMTMDALNKLKGRAKELSDDELRAIVKRERELKNGKQ